MDQPDYVKCIKHTHVANIDTSWCGRKLWSYEWSFQSLDHAAYNGREAGRLVACQECVSAAVSALAPWASVAAIGLAVKDGHLAGGAER